MNMIARLGSWAALALALAVGGCQGQTASDEAFGRRVRAYLLNHPEVLQEVAARLDARDAAAQQMDLHRAERLLPSLRNAVERDPRDFVANPGGRVTVTEFYDYRCPHCADAAPQILALIRGAPDVRFVFKEMPIFGPVSEHAARAALAVKAAGGDYLSLYTTMMATRPLTEPVIDQIAHRQGAISVPAANPHLAATAALFNQLALGGTPAFIVGDQIIYGEDMDGVNAAIGKASGSRMAKN